MRKRITIMVALVALCLSQAPAWATCTRNASVTGSSTQIIGASAIAGGRKYVSVQNTGTVTIGCAIQSGNTAASTNTFQLTAGQMYEFPSQTTGYPPQGDVACYSTGATSAATACEY